MHYGVIFKTNLWNFDNIYGIWTLGHLSWTLTNFVCFAIFCLFLSVWANKPVELWWHPWHLSPVPLELGFDQFVCLSVAFVFCLLHFCLFVRANKPEELWWHPWHLNPGPLVLGFDQFSQHSEGRLHTLAKLSLLCWEKKEFYNFVWIHQSYGTARISR